MTPKSKAPSAHGPRHPNARNTIQRRGPSHLNKALVTLHRTKHVRAIMMFKIPAVRVIGEPILLQSETRPL